MSRKMFKEYTREELEARLKDPKVGIRQKYRIRAFLGLCKPHKQQEEPAANAYEYSTGKWV